MTRVDVALRDSMSTAVRLRVYESLPAGLLDGDPGVRISSHIFVGSKASWCEINDDIPKHEEWAPGEDMNERADSLKRQE